MAAYESECLAAGLDPKEVNRIAGRIKRAAIDAAKLGLKVFGGSGDGSLRSIRHDDDRSRPLVVASIDGGMWDGGDGACGHAEDGLLRGGNQSAWFRAKHVIAAISTAIRSRSDLREETCSEAFAAELDEKEFRDCFAEDQIRVRLALQIRALRQQRGLSQSQFGELVGMPQSSVARFENPDSGRLTLSSLFKIAAAFDIAFVGEFVDHRALLERTRSMTKERLEVESYTAQTLRAATPITTAGDMG